MVTGAILEPKGALNLEMESYKTRFSTGTPVGTVNYHMPKQYIGLPVNKAKTQM